MLLSDGSVTRHLQIMTGAKVAVVSSPVFITLLLRSCSHC